MRNDQKFLFSEKQQQTTFVFFDSQHGNLLMQNIAIYEIESTHSKQKQLLIKSSMMNIDAVSQSGGTAEDNGGREEDNVNNNVNNCTDQMDGGNGGGREDVNNCTEKRDGGNRGGQKDGKGGKKGDGKGGKKGDGKGGKKGDEVEEDVEMENGNLEDTPTTEETQNENQNGLLSFMFLCTLHFGIIAVYVLFSMSFHERLCYYTSISQLSLSQTQRNCDTISVQFIISPLFRNIAHVVPYSITLTPSLPLSLALSHISHCTLSPSIFVVFSDRG